MKNKISFYFLFLLLFSLQLIAQNPLVKQWDKRFGGTSEDWITTFQQTTDGGYVLGGRSWSDISGDKTQANWDTNRNFSDYWILKIDSLGSKQWDKRFGTVGIDNLNSLQQTFDGGYILGGYSDYPDSSGDKTQPSWGNRDYWAVKTDSVGNKQWDKRFGGIDDDRLYSVVQCYDGGYLFAGFSNSDSSGDKTQHTQGAYDYWIVKINSVGNKQWDKRFGGTGADFLYALQQTFDGGYILGGYSSSDSTGDKTQHRQGGPDYWIVKIDSLGTKQWDKRFGGAWNDYLYSLRQTADGGYILGGLSASDSSGDMTQHSWGADDYWIVKIDSLGIKQWDKRFGGILSEDDFGNISQTSEGGYLISGTSYSDSSGDKSENNLGLEQEWIVKTDSLGNKQWEKTIFTTGHDEGGYAIQTNDGCYVFANYTTGGIGGYKTQLNWNTNGTYDFWIIKFCDTTQYCNVAASITASQTSFCSGDSAHICATSGFTNYLWSTGESDSCINVKLAGNYYISVTDANGCSAFSNHIAIIVYSLPSVSIIENGDTLAVHNAVNYQWYLNDSSIVGAIASTFIASQSGNYTVAITDSNGCSAISNPVIVTRIESLAEDDMVNVYPNPLTNEYSGWQLIVGNSLLGGVAEIFAADGRVILRSKIKDQKSRIEFEGTCGIYLLQISTAKSNVVMKLVKE